jgi:hypothetical protein
MSGPISNMRMILGKQSREESQKKKKRTSQTPGRDEAASRGINALVEFRAEV